MLSNLSKVVTGKFETDMISKFLNVVAGSRTWQDSTSSGSPLMPIRGHLFSRGMPRLSICPRCASFHKLDTIRCDMEKSNGEICNARPFELLYGRSTGVAFLNLWLKNSNVVSGVDTVAVSNKTQYVWSNSSEGEMGDYRVGLAAWRCTKDDNFTHVLDMDKGVITPRREFDNSKFNIEIHAYLKISGFQDGVFDSQILWKRGGSDEKEFFDKKCPATSRDNSRRISNK